VRAVHSVSTVPTSSRTKDEQGTHTFPCPFAVSVPSSGYPFMSRLYFVSDANEGLEYVF